MFLGQHLNKRCKFPHVLQYIVLSQLNPIHRLLQLSHSQSLFLDVVGLKQLLDVYCLEVDRLQVVIHQVYLLLLIQIVSLRLLGGELPNKVRCD